jgi:sulfite reductase (NADPH) hemoprotein beta-component
VYRYDEIDATLVAERVAQFRDQTRRFLAGSLPEEEYRPLRLRNGLYIQKHAPMLRVAVPYGLLSTRQLRMLAHLARKYDRGYGHFTTRQNLQLNWVRLEDVPTILDELASVEMHAIQTSGNCVRNVTSDPFAGVARDEDVDPRPYCELLRQYSTFHPEFAYLPRKFKIAVTGSQHDRAAIAVHDIGLRVLRDEAGDVGFEVFVGGGQGRTPVLATKIRAFLPERDLLSYTEAILRIYNELGRRDNIYKARIKILVNHA